MSPSRQYFEELAEQLADALPLPLVMSRTRDAIQLTWGGEDGVVVILTPEAVELRLPRIVWIGAHDCADSSRLWRRKKLGDSDDPLDLDTIRAAIRDARERRRREFRPCRFCREPTPPERRTGRACHGCASRRLGAVY